jgi:hypothetical protein
MLIEREFDLLPEPAPAPGETIHTSIRVARPFLAQVDVPFVM